MRTPQEALQLVGESFNRGDLEGVLQFYEEAHLRSNEAGSERPQFEYAANTIWGYLTAVNSL